MKADEMTNFIKSLA